MTDNVECFEKVNKDYWKMLSIIERLTYSIS